MASALSIAPSEQKALCFRLLALVVDGGTTVLRHQFDIYIRPDELKNTLSEPANRKTLSDLLKKKVITKKQWDDLYPQINTPNKPSSDEFDVTLLGLLLRHVCGIDSTSNYWSHGIPPSFDESLVADISRLRHVRNEFAHVKSIHLNEAKFQQKWNELEKVILRLGKGIPDLADNIQKLKTCTIDPANESIYIAELKRWKQNEYDLQADLSETKEKVKDIERSVSSITNTVTQQTLKLDNVTTKLIKLADHNKETKEIHDDVIKDMRSRQEDLNDNIIEERNVRETQHNLVAQRVNDVEEKVEHIHANMKQKMRVSDQDDSSELRRLKSLANLITEDNERDSLYVTTEAHKQAKEKLLKSGLVVLSGNPGEGKTTMAAKLISELTKPGGCLKLNHPTDMKNIDFQSHAFEIIFIDDIFGAGVLDENLLKEWSLWFQDLFRLAGVKKNKKKLIITTRHYILSEAKQTVKHKLFDVCNTQLLSSSQLTTPEMKQMIELHLRYFDRETSEWEVNYIVEAYRDTFSFKRPFQYMEKIGKQFSTVEWEKLTTMTGFPETVRLFASNDELFDQGTFFFTKPYVFFRNCIEELFLQEEKFFALFLIWSMPKQKLNRSQIELGRINMQDLDNFSKAVKWFGFDRPWTPTMVRLLLRSLSQNCGGILTYHEKSGEILFCHNVAKDTVGLVVGKECPGAILELASKDFLLEYTTVNEKRNDDLHIFFESFRYDELNSAIIRALKKKDVKYLFGLIGIRTKEHDHFHDSMYLGSYEINISMLKHDCFHNELFLTVFCNSEEGRNLLFQPITWIRGELKNCGLDFGAAKIPVYLASRALLFGNAKLLESFMKFHWKTFVNKEQFLYISLLMAARVGQMDAVELLLRYGAEVKGEIIFIATSNNHINVVERLLDNHASGLESYKRIYNQNSPLIEAAKKGYVDIMRILIRHGFDVNYKNANNQTALHKALFPHQYNTKSCEVAFRWDENIYNRHFEVYKLLIENGASFKTKSGIYKRTQLHVAADLGHTKVVELLIEKGASLNVKDYRGQYPVHCAVIGGHCDTVQAILNADKSQISLRLTSHGTKSFFKGMTLLHIAIWKNKHRMVELLMKNNADPNIQDAYGRTSVYYAAYRSLPFTCELLLRNCSNVQQPEKNGMTPLHAAVFKGHKKIANLISEVAFDKEPTLKVNKRLMKHRNVYAMAALEQAIYNDDVEACEHLLQNGAHLNYNTGKFKRTPLHFAADVGSSRTAELLISRGASLYAKDCRGYMPIQCAAIRGNNDIVKIILHADITQVQAKLPSCGSFRKRTMDLYHIAVLVWNEGLIDILIQHGVDPNTQDIYGKTPLNVAVQKGAKVVVQKLISVADVNLSDNNGHTPLHTAIHRLRTDVAELLCPVSDVNIQDKYGDTPLHKACLRLNFEIFKTLIEQCNADLDIRNKQGNSIMDIYERRRPGKSMVKFDKDLFLCGSNPFVAQDEYYRVVIAKKYSSIR